MKKPYEPASADVVELSLVDILTSSDGVPIAPKDDDLLNPM